MAPPEDTPPLVISGDEAALVRSLSLALMARRLLAAEGQLRRISACTREWKLLVGDDPGALADAILAIIGTEED